MKISQLVAVIIGLSTAVSLAINPVFAQSDDDASTVDGPERCPRLQASTIFIPDKTGSRQKGSANRLSESHRDAQAQGWDFSDLEIYIEDGDLQGFFVTYTRPHPCNDNTGTGEPVSE